MTTDGHKASRGDLAVSVAILALFLALYRATAQARMTGDGPVLADALLLDGALHWHVLYLPMGRAMAALVGTADPLPPLSILSALGGAVGLACAYLLARRLEVERRAAILATLLIGLSPGVWFHATSIEVHAPHAGVVGVALIALAYAPTRRAAVLVAVAGVGLVLAILSHLSGILLGLGFVLLCGHRSDRSGRGLRARRTWLVIAPILLAIEAATIGAVWLGWNGAASDTTQTPLAFVSNYARIGDALEFVWRDVIQPLALGVPFLVLGAVRGWGAPRSRAAVLVAVGAILPPLVFFVPWGISERGGYWMGLVPFLVVLLGCGLGRGWARPAWTAALVVLVLGQAALGLRSVRTHDRGYDPRVRAALLQAALPDGGVVGRVGYLAPALRIEGIQEVDLTEPIRRGFAAGRSVEEVADEIGAAVDEVLGESPVVLDLSYRSVPWTNVEPEFVRFVHGVEDELRLRYEVTLVPDPDPDPDPDPESGTGTGTEEDRGGDWILLAVRSRR